ncbi:MAG TPA: type II toxin-antitoxin system VapC family toxin [Armatimonadota bacterium]|nr:type II toxin-antitoxin system VapC family toxin [Armatimonadota bacterium]
MRLLDTHALIWWDSEPAKLSARALALRGNPEVQLILSTASLWEMQIKLQLGKLELALPLPEIVQAQQLRNGLILLPVTPAYVFALDSLPPAHKDPFDRLLIAPALSEGIAVLTRDASFSDYPVPVEW